MTKIKCRKCGKVYPFEDKICPVCGYDIRKDDTLSPRDRNALGAESSAKPFDPTKVFSVSDEDMDRWKSQTREERQKEAWERRNELRIAPDRSGLPRLNMPLSSMLIITAVMIIIVCVLSFVH